MLQIIKQEVSKHTCKKSFGDYYCVSGSLLTENFLQNLLSVDNEGIVAWQRSIKELLDNDKIVVNIPMKEKEPVIESTISDILELQRAKCVCVIDGGSSKKAIAAVKENNVRLVSQDEILDVLDWNRLLPILSLTEGPKGKGTTVLAGYLFRYLSAMYFGYSAPQWIIHTDADVHASFHPIDYLCWGILNSSKDILHIKTAKSSRNNEVCMSARSSLAVLRQLPLVCQCADSEQIAYRAKVLFEHLVKYKWMLSGIFALKWDIAMLRPIATGYLDETLTCAFVEDYAESCGGATNQLVNPNPCIDGLSDFTKESVLMQIVSNFIFTLALAQKPVNEWILTDINWINNVLMKESNQMAFIPLDNEKPVEIRTVDNERIFPSVIMLERNGLINHNKAKALLEKMGV